MEKIQENIIEALGEQGRKNAYWAWRNAKRIISDLQELMDESDPIDMIQSGQVWDELQPRIQSLLQKTKTEIIAGFSWGEVLNQDVWGNI